NMFDTYEVAKQLVVRLRDVVPVIQRVDHDLADQLRRAASSVVLNLAEGQRFDNGNKLRHYKIAQGSAHEVKAALDVAEAWGYLTQATKERALLDRLLALLWRLTRSPKLQPVVRRNDAKPPAS
ncbi:MAG: four helix bundle protein, partial [Kofleriaceae bacterium]